MHEYKSRPDEGEDLWSLLAVSLIDPYERQSKASPCEADSRERQAS